MSDHLPECTYHPGYPEPVGPMGPDAMVGKKPCICDRLRACEQRVLSVAGPHNYSRGRKDGYAAGVQAARDAVVALEQYVNIPYESPSPAMNGEQGEWVWRSHVLAAIDALREDTK